MNQLDSVALVNLLERMNNSKNVNLRNKTTNLPGTTRLVFPKPKDNLMYKVAQNAAAPMINKPLTDYVCKEIRTQAQAVEPEIGFVYTNYCNSLDNPREWVIQVQALMVIEAEGSIDTVFKHLNITPPSRLMMRAALYQYMKSLYWGYVNSMKAFN